ncbi:hypothetical protein RRG08_014248 [Elysia crispata]|uniref:Uncharacterized protein n=1 Tax=Elysia crispata TaxID=231223 RepID=A0AAE0XET0_9GAST|nr:hypothetical protein RRG08_014248 [Elysia crispata]
METINNRNFMQRKRNLAMPQGTSVNTDPARRKHNVLRQTQSAVFTARLTLTRRAQAAGYRPSLVPIAPDCGLLSHLSRLVTGLSHLSP